MARVFAFQAHRVRWQLPVKGKVNPSLQEVIFPAGEVREVPDDLAEYVTGAHPQKLKLLGEHEAPPSFGGGAYADTSMGDSPANRMLSQDTELCLQPKKDGSPCQSTKPCRWHR